MNTLLFITLLILSVSNAFFNSHMIRNHANSRTLAMQTTPLVSAAGKRFEAKPGSPLGPACAKIGVKVTYSCKKGDCGVCTVSVGGKKMKACVSKVPPAPKLKSLIEKGLITKYEG